MSRPWVFRRGFDGWIRVILPGNGRDRRRGAGVEIGLVRRDGRQWVARWAMKEVRHRTQDAAALTLLVEFGRRRGIDVDAGTPPGRLGRRDADPNQLVLADTRAPPPAPLPGVDLERGRRLRRARQNLGLRLVDLAVTVPGLDVPTLSRIERGHAVPAETVWSALEARVATLAAPWIVEWGRWEKREQPPRGALAELARCNGHREALAVAEAAELQATGCRRLDWRDWHPWARGRNEWDPAGGKWAAVGGHAIVIYRA